MLFGAGNKEGARPFFCAWVCAGLSRHIFTYCRLGCHAQVTLAQAMSDLDKRSVASLAPYTERYLPPSCLEFSLSVECFLPVPSLIPTEDVTSVT